MSLKMEVIFHRKLLCPVLQFLNRIDNGKWWSDSHNHYYDDNDIVSDDDDVHNDTMLARMFASVMLRTTKTELPAAEV